MVFGTAPQLHPFCFNCNECNSSFLLSSLAKCNIFSLCSSSINWCSSLAVFIWSCTSSSRASLNLSSLAVTLALETFGFNTLDTLDFKAFGCHLSQLFSESNTTTITYNTLHESIPTFSMGLWAN